MKVPEDSRSPVDASVDIVSSDAIRHTCFNERGAECLGLGAAAADREGALAPGRADRGEGGGIGSSMTMGKEQEISVRGELDSQGYAMESGPARL